MPDLSLTCPECSQEFAYTEAEQEQAAASGFSAPTYCPDCHARRKVDRDAERAKKRPRRKHYRK